MEKEGRNWGGKACVSGERGEELGRKGLCQWRKRGGIGEERLVSVEKEGRNWGGKACVSGERGEELGRKGLCQWRKRGGIGEERKIVEKVSVLPRIEKGHGAA